MWNVLVLLLPLAGIRGTVRDIGTRAPIAGVTVQVLGRIEGTITDSLGRFALDAEPGVRLRLGRFGYAPHEITATDSVLDVLLTPTARSLEGVTVTALRAEGARDGGAPITQRVVSQQEIERQYSGQEMPFLLSTTPSVTVYSDGGAYSNYTYFRVRGMDQSRVNITLDGVPLNDAEDQGVFFSNFPDFANSMQSVQVQRGVGTSSQGVASYAGSINFESVALGRSERRGEVQLSRGAFNTTRGSAEWQSGLLPSRFAFYGRLSALDTDGYRHHAGNRSTGAFASAGYFGERTSAKLTALTGVSKNQLAYLAASIDDIRADPRNNALPPSDRDRFDQTLVSLAVTRLLGTSSTLSATAYTVDAGGDYDVTFGQDISNFNLASRVTGAFATYNRQMARWTLSAGAHANTYHRDHFLFLRPDLSTELYRNRGEKDDASAFAKVAFDAGRLTLFGDVQGRRTWYRYQPDRNAGIAPSRTAWSFLNPKIGATWTASPGLFLYASLGSNGREPARNDMFAGFDNVDTTNAAFVGPLDRVRPERVTNAEAGVTRRGRNLDVTVSAFAMRFRTEITPIGALSYIGLPLRKNVRSSLRDGVEADITWRGFRRAVFGVNATWMRGRIDEFTDDATGQTYRDVPPLLTPAFTSNQSLQFALTRSLSLGVDGRYVSRSYLANTGDARFVTPPAWLMDAALTWNVRRLSVLAQLRNAFNREFFSGGYTDGTTSYYYVAAPRNLTLTTKVGF
jgi:iron complex outermembrane receptor protein